MKRMPGRKPLPNLDGDQLLYLKERQIKYYAKVRLQVSTTNRFQYEVSYIIIVTQEYIPIQDRPTELGIPLGVVRKTFRYETLF